MNLLRRPVVSAVSRLAHLTMVRRIVTVFLAIATSIAFSLAPAEAAPPSSILVSGHICHGAGGICVGEEPTVFNGTGQNVRIIQFNQCSGQGTVCTNELVLTGTFGKVVIERANECSDGATCSNIVEIEGTVKSVQAKNILINFEGILIKNRCDATATCSNTP